MAKRILVLGGTGTLGSAATRQLLEAGFRVRLLARNPDKARAASPEAVEIVRGDVTDPASLAAAMQECQGVHISVGGEVDQLSAEAVSGLAKQAGVERISYISGATVSEQNEWFPLVAQKLKAEAAVRNSGVAFVILRPTWVMEMLPRFARGGKPAMFGRQPHPIHWYAADDLGRMVAQAHVKPEAANRTVYVHGPEAFTMSEALQRYCEILHPQSAGVSRMPFWLARLIAALTGN